MSRTTRVVSVMSSVDSAAGRGISTVISGAYWLRLSCVSVVTKKLCASMGTQKVFVCWESRSMAV